MALRSNTPPPVRSLPTFPRVSIAKKRDNSFARPELDSDFPVGESYEMPLPRVLMKNWVIHWKARESPTPHPNEIMQRVDFLNIFNYKSPFKEVPMKRAAISTILAVAVCFSFSVQANEGGNYQELIRIYKELADVTVGSAKARWGHEVFVLKDNVLYVFDPDAYRLTKGNPPFKISLAKIPLQLDGEIHLSILYNKNFFGKRWLRAYVRIGSEEKITLQGETFSTKTIALSDAAQVASESLKDSATAAPLETITAAEAVRVLKEELMRRIPTAHPYIDTIDREWFLTTPEATHARVDKVFRNLQDLNEFSGLIRVGEQNIKTPEN